MFIYKSDNVMHAPCIIQIRQTVYSSEVLLSHCYLGRLKRLREFFKRCQLKSANQTNRNINVLGNPFLYREELAANRKYHTDIRGVLKGIDIPPFPSNQLIRQMLEVGIRMMGLVKINQC